METKFAVRNNFALLPFVLNFKGDTHPKSKLQ